jgi:hypothetical protein
MAFHAFHTLSFPWPAFRPGDAGFTATSTSAMGRTRKGVFVVIVVDECFGDFAESQVPSSQDPAHDPTPLIESHKRVRLEVREPEREYEGETRLYTND